MLLGLHGPAGQPQLRCRRRAGPGWREAGPQGPQRCARQQCRQPGQAAGSSLADLETEQPQGLGFNGGPSPSAVFETARMQVPIFQSIQEREGQQATDSISVEHIPGFASVGSNVYEARPWLWLTQWSCWAGSCAGTASTRRAASQPAGASRCATQRAASTSGTQAHR